MTQADILTVLTNHKKWLQGEYGGTRANLRGANLSDSNLSDSSMRGADLRGANLSDANLSHSNMRGADLRGADLRGANLSDANLSDSNMRGADLSDANLSGAKISWTVGNAQEIKSMHIDTYVVSWVGDVLAIGCQQHTLQDWDSYSDAEIDDMDPKALGFWKKWKDMIFRCVELSKETL